jgi:hypothetical protein
MLRCSISRQRNAVSKTADMNHRRWWRPQQHNLEWFFDNYCGGAFETTGVFVKIGEPNLKQTRFLVIVI